MNRNRTTAAVLATTAFAAAALTGAGAASAHDGAYHEPTTSQLHSRQDAGRALAELRRDLTPYQDVERVLADGFVQASECTESPDGGMGVHFLNPARAMAPVDPASPAILLYEVTDDGYRLLGAEWFQADADQDLTTDDDRPNLWGRPFDGPMLGHEPGMPVHYDLHVWLYQANPDGVFASWNPSVSC
jgi:hypothetical protein